MVTEPTSWSDELVHDIAPDLFPEIITTDELVRLMERTREPKQAIGGFEWTSSADCRIHRARGRFGDRLAGQDGGSHRARTSPDTRPSLHPKRIRPPRPCARDVVSPQLSAATEKPDAALIRASVIASRLGADETGESEPVSKLRAHFTGDGRATK